MPRPEKPLTVEQTHSRFIAGLWGWGAAALIMWTMSQPLLRYASAADVALLGWLIGIGVIAAALASQNTKRTAIALGLFAMICAVVSIFEGYTLLSGAMHTSIVNEARCRVIEEDLLRPNRYMADAADRFQALGCAPRYTGELFIGSYGADPVNQVAAEGR